MRNFNIILLLLAISSCGVKGDLKLHDDPSVTKQHPTLDEPLDITNDQ